VNVLHYSTAQPASSFCAPMVCFLFPLPFLHGRSVPNDMASCSCGGSKIQNYLCIFLWNVWFFVIRLLSISYGTNSRCLEIPHLNTNFIRNIFMRNNLVQNARLNFFEVCRKKENTEISHTGKISFSPSEETKVVIGLGGFFFLSRRRYNNVEPRGFDGSGIYTRSSINVL